MGIKWTEKDVLDAFEKAISKGLNRNTQQPSQARKVLEQLKASSALPSPTIKRE